MNYRNVLIPAVILSAQAALAQTPLSERVGSGDRALAAIEPWQPAGAFANPWPDQWEQAFRERRQEAIKLFQGKASAKNTGEGEKWGLPLSIGAWFAGDTWAAMDTMQVQDPQADRDHAHTAGIDLYWSFTLKGQVRKWFDFAEMMKPEYRQQFRNAMDAWTQSDPRPSMEYVGLLEDASPELREFLYEQLDAMWRDTEALKQMADEAEAEGHKNKKRFAAYIRKNADNIGGAHPGRDPQKWRDWWAAIADGDWMIFEEYERRTNPNPHPRYGIGSGPVGSAWDPKVRGMRADARNTDNLRGMREVAIYLFAEQSGNERIRELYAQRIRRTAFSFWNVGNGEWDSETYLGHTISAYFNLYDFAKDPLVRGQAKAILDFLFTSAAVKYRRGAWAGPLVRDYGNKAPWSTSAHTVWLFFGDAPMSPTKLEKEHAFFFSSAYRPPAAVTALARKQFAEPWELLASHPTYQNFLPGADEEPQYHEFTYFGGTYQLGTMLEGHGYNRNGFKLLVDHPEKGADYIIPSTGKLRNGVTNTAGGDRIAQYKSGALYLNPKGDVPFHILGPEHAHVIKTGTIRIIDLSHTWVALLPIDLEWSGGESLLNGAGFGFAMEVGNAQSHGSLGAFQRAVESKTKVKRTDNGAQVRFSDGRTLELQSDGTLLRDGVVHDPATDHRFLWQPAAGGHTPLSLGWKERKLIVEVDGYRFEAELKADGSYKFQNSEL
jgi:hypothetical protein